MKKVIAVCGSDGNDPHLSEGALETAEKIGYLIAQKGAVLVCGGGGGIMEAACRGAKRAHGLTIGILPANKDYANPFVDIGLTTHLGRARNYILVRSAGVIIGIAGRWGTLNEIALALNIGKPTVVVQGTGGWMDMLSHREVQNLLKDFARRPFIATSAEEAVQLAFQLIR